MFLYIEIFNINSWFLGIANFFHLHMYKYCNIIYTYLTIIHLILTVVLILLVNILIYFKFV